MLNVRRFHYTGINAQPLRELHSSRDRIFNLFSAAQHNIKFVFLPAIASIAVNIPLNINLNLITHPAVTVYWSVPCKFLLLQTFVIECHWRAFNLARDCFWLQTRMIEILLVAVYGGLKPQSINESLDIINDLNSVWNVSYQMVVFF